MNSKLHILLSMIVLIAGLNKVFPQTAQPQIENIQFHFDESIQAIIITYDLVNYSDLESYQIELVFIDGNNNSVFPQTMVGDVGNEISGGNGKQIVWEIYNDVDGLTETAQPQLRIMAINDIPVDPSIALIMDQLSSSNAQKYHFKIGRDGLMIFGAGTVVGSIVLNLKASDYIDQASLSSDYDEYELLGRKADTYYTLSYISGGLAAVSIGLAAYQYIRGDKNNPKKNSLSIAPANQKGVMLAWTRKF